MIFQYIDHPEIQAFSRLVLMRKNLGKLTFKEVDDLSFLATEHGISRDHAIEIMDMLDLPITSL